ncbi:MAG TPA: recombinase RecX [Flavobacteriales bacterium]|nr:recombinase RecX [Flavobacteriales bacterium]|tara:strand:+ start:17481 stop:17942 length:462 start_codon:yes stop_codon:yes gene_type:complete
MDLNFILEKLKSYCAYQERCTKDIIEKLHSLNVPPQLYEEILNYLKEYDFVNDERFLHSYIHGKVNLKRWGPQKIIWQLQKKGFSKSDIQTFLNEINRETLKVNALNLAQQKLNNKKLSYENKGKIYRYLYNKGYYPEMIYEIIGELENITRT